MTTQPVSLDLTEVQGMIHHPYRLPIVRHLMFEMKGRQSGRKFLRFLAPQVTYAAATNDEESKRALNVGITFRGLQALRKEKPHRSRPAP